MCSFFCAPVISLYMPISFPHNELKTQWVRNVSTHFNEIASLKALPQVLIEALGVKFQCVNVVSIRYNPQLLRLAGFKGFFPFTSNISSSVISSTICISDGLF